MTAQVPDWLHYQGQKHRMCANPLESFFDDDHPRPDFKSPDTACWRGYVAEWEVEDDALCLVGLVGWVGGDHDRYANNARQVGLEDLFPWAPGRIKATWFTGEVRVPQGEQLEYVHAEYQTIYERDLMLSFDRGRLVHTEVRDNRHLIPEIRKRQAEREGKWEKARPYMEKALFGRRVPWRSRDRIDKMATVMAMVVLIVVLPFIVPYLIYKRGWNPKKWNLF